MGSKHDQMQNAGGGVWGEGMGGHGERWVMGFIAQVGMWIHVGELELDFLDPMHPMHGDHVPHTLESRIVRWNHDEGRARFTLPGTDRNFTLPRLIDFLTSQLPNFPTP